MKLSWLILGVLLVAAGCGRQPAGSPPPQTDPLRGLTFLAGEMTVDGQPHALVADTEVSVEFTDDGRLIAWAGCNTMQGAVDTADGRLTVEGGLSITELGCDKPRHDQDELVAGVLGAAPAWRLDGSRLEIVSGATKLTLTEQSVAQPDRALEGTTWLVDTLVDGEVAASTTVGAEPVTLVFDGQRVVADTHCNGVTAEYTVTGDKIRFTAGASTLIECAPDIMRVENAVSEVLRDEVTVELTADRLTLTHPSGKGIQLHAQ